jgi:WD40 repeat protein
VVHPAAVSTVAFAPTGHDLVSGAVDGSLQVTRDDRDPIELPSSPAGIDGALILASGQVVASDAGSRLRVIDPERRIVVTELAAPSRARLLRPSPDETRLVTIALRGSPVPPTLWDLAEHRLVAALEGHAGRVFTARFVSNGREILTAGQDGTARLWNAATGRSRRTFRGSSQFLADATLAPDGLLVVAGGGDGHLRFWGTSSGRLLWTLPAHKSSVVGVHYEGNDLVTRGFAGDVSRWTLPPAGKILEACHASACAPPTSAGD